ncbi:hypothetical protein J1N35_005640 [Gossypium stocksii]|uniref:Uncharacterized protein n=1 Tax=Gossypium stocksii TaxID=47602 RepID=A0A9D4AJG0_9ROSI|nr:hypothetical protein J1N35_005640 [Gossypium stocksii]
MLNLISLSHRLVVLFLELSMSKKGSSSKMMAAKVPAELEGIASTPKFKQRKVSAIWDFLPGCGRVSTLKNS